MRDRILDKADEMALAAVTSDIMTMALKWATQEKMELVLEVPSLPEGTIPPMYLPRIDVNGLDVNIGTSGHPGVLFGIGIGIRNPKPSSQAKNFAAPKRNSHNVLRVDYMNYIGQFNNPQYEPHYHAGNKTDSGEGDGARHHWLFPRNGF